MTNQIAHYIDQWQMIDQTSTDAPCWRIQHQMPLRLGIKMTTIIVAFGLCCTWCKLDWRVNNWGQRHREQPPVEPLRYAPTLAMLHAVSSDARATVHEPRTFASHSKNCLRRTVTAAARLVGSNKRTQLQLEKIDRIRRDIDRVLATFLLNEQKDWP